MQKKEKFERVLNVDNGNILKILTHTSVSCFKRQSLQISRT